MSLLTRVTSLPSAARLAAQVRIRASLVPVRKPAGSTVGIAVVQLDLERTALRANGNRLIESPVFESQIVEHPQRLTREPAQLVVVAFGLQLADHDEGDDDLVFGEPAACPGIGQQHGGVEHVGLRGDGRISHVALLGPCGTARTPSGWIPRYQDRGRSLFVETTGTARIAEHVGHRDRRYSRREDCAAQARRDRNVTTRLTNWTTNSASAGASATPQCGDAIGERPCAVRRRRRCRPRRRRGPCPDRRRCRHRWVRRRRPGWRSRRSSRRAAWSDSARRGWRRTPRDAPRPWRSGRPCRFRIGSVIWACRLRQNTACARSRSAMKTSVSIWL